jgi:hypothetical protein
MIPKITEHNVDGDMINVWHPKGDETSYSISFGGGGWMVGSYDSIESALMGAELDLLGDVDFYDLQQRVNHFDKEDRLITVKDLQPLLTNPSQ